MSAFQVFYRVATLLSLVVIFSTCGVCEKVQQKKELSFAGVDEVIVKAISEKRAPGAVVIVGNNKEIIYEHAYGFRQLLPTSQRMELETIFDIASLTKIVATTTAIMLLYEPGLIDIKKSVATYLPDFGVQGKGKVTIEQIMRHRAGLIPGNPKEEYKNGFPTALKSIYALPPAYPPGTKYEYSDLGYIVLVAIIEKITGMKFDQFCQEKIFKPLGMNHTCFNPPASLHEFCAPCERDECGNWLKGVVHDPRARLLGGVAGHAGVFSTAHDLVCFCQMILNKGVSRGQQFLKKETIEMMSQHDNLPPGEQRGLGWDINTPHSSPRGTLFSASSFGHTGFTGTSLWIDPVNNCFVVLLTNRLHPDASGNVIQLRREVATAAAKSLGL